MWAVYSFLSFAWWLNLAYFIFVSVVCWFIPGLVLLSWTKLEKHIQFVISPILGICVFVVGAYLFGWLQIRWLMYLYVVGFSILAYRRRKHIFPITFSFELPKIVYGIIGVGIISQMIPVFASGFRYNQGIKYYFVNMFDGVFHLSLSRSLIESIPPFQPGAIGLPVTNYHYLSNLVIAELTQLWHLPLNHLHFQYVPLFLSIWLGVTIAVLLQTWAKNRWTIIIGLVVFYFVGELTWLIDLVLGSHSSAPFEAYIDHSIIQFMNPPQAFGKIVFFSTLLMWHVFWKKKSYLLAVLIGLMTATLVGFKVYFGLAVGIGVATVIIFNFIQHLYQYVVNNKVLQVTQLQKEYGPLLVLIGVTCLVGALIYFPTNAKAGGLFFSFLNWPKEFLGFTKLNWNEWWLRLQVYQQAQNYKALVVWYGLAAGIFLLAIFHLKLFSLGAFVKKFRQKMQFEEVLFLLVPALLFIFVGMNYLQVSGGANSFNFFVVALASMNLLTALVVGSIGKRKIIKGISLGIAFVVSVQFFALCFFFLRSYYQGHNSYTYTTDHQQALAYLSQLDTKPVLLQTHPKDHINSNAPYLYFFTGQKSYLGGIQILESHNQDIRERLELVNTLFSLTTSGTRSAQLAHEVGISHVLFDKKGAGGLFYPQYVKTATFSAYFRWQEVFGNEQYAVLELVEPESL